MERILEEIRLINERLNKIEIIGAGNIPQIREENPREGVRREEVWHNREHGEENRHEDRWNNGRNWEHRAWREGESRIFHRRNGQQPQIRPQDLRTQPQGRPFRENSNTRPRGSSFPSRFPSGQRISNQSGNTSDRPRTIETGVGLLTKKLYQAIQLRHHEQNWQNLPNKIDRKFEEALELVTPPMPDEELRREIQAVLDETKTKTLLLVQGHLKRKQKETREALANLRDSNLPREEAEGMARVRLMNHFRGKLDRNDVNKWLVELRTEREVQGPPPGPKPRAPQQIESNHWEASRKANKRSREVTPPVQTSNRFQLFENISSDEEGEDWPEPTTRPAKRCDKRGSPTQVAKKTTPGTEGGKRDNTPMDTVREEVEDQERIESIAEIESVVEIESIVRMEGVGETDEVIPVEQDSSSSQETHILQKSSTDNQPSRVTPQSEPEQVHVGPSSQPIFSDPRSSSPEIAIQGRLTTVTHPRKTIHEAKNKTAWTIPILHPDTRTLVIADSQFRNIQGLPESFEVHVFPGLRLSHAVNLLDNLRTKRNNIQRIIMHVGINNRTCNTNAVKAEANEMISSLKKMKCVAYVCGVSIPSRLSMKETAVLNLLNGHLREMLKQLFIEPVPTDEVSVSPNDVLFGIHYDTTTLNKISIKLNKAFLGSRSSNHRLSL